MMYDPEYMDEPGGFADDDTRICTKTTSLNFPHHEKCLFKNGHPTCNCESEEQRKCDAYECFVPPYDKYDQGRRLPDGSSRSLSNQLIEEIETKKQLEMQQKMIMEYGGYSSDIEDLTPLLENYNNGVNILNKNEDHKNTHQEITENSDKDSDPDLYDKYTKKKIKKRIKTNLNNVYVVVYDE